MRKRRVQKRIIVHFVRTWRKFYAFYNSCAFHAYIGIRHSCYLLLAQFRLSYFFFVFFCFFRKGTVPFRNLSYSWTLLFDYRSSLQCVSNSSSLQIAVFLPKRSTLAFSASIETILTVFWSISSWCLAIVPWCLLFPCWGGMCRTFQSRKRLLLWSISFFLNLFDRLFFIFFVHTVWHFY